MLSVLDTYMTAHGFDWPARVSAAGNISDMHAVVRAFMSSEADNLVGMVYIGGDADTYLELIQACASLVPGRKVMEEVCLLAADIFDISVYVMQHMPRDKALHVTSYGGTVCGVNVALSRPVCMSRSHICEERACSLVQHSTTVSPTLAGKAGRHGRRGDAMLWSGQKKGNRPQVIIVAMRLQHQ